MWSNMHPFSPIFLTSFFKWNTLYHYQTLSQMIRLATHIKVAQRILSCNEFRLRTNFMSFFLKTLQDNHSIETKIMHEYRQKNLWEFYHSSIYINCTEEVIEMNLNFFALICKAGETKKNQIPLAI